MLEWRATVRPEVAALVDDRGAVYSYARLRAEYERRAGGWAELGIGPGDEVAIVAKNSADFLVHTFAVLRAGATPAFVNWRQSRSTLAALSATETARTGQAGFRRFGLCREAGRRLLGSARSRKRS